MCPTRRDFLSTSALLAAGIGTNPLAETRQNPAIDYKPPQRPVIITRETGCYTDQNIGSVGATGNGEENIKVAGAHTIVDQMRLGATPKEAGMEALRRIAANYNNDITRLRYLDMIYYIVRRDGAYAGVSLWGTRETGERKKFVVHDGTLRTEPCDYLFEGTTQSIHSF